jgi:hypothetical protein
MNVNLNLEAGKFCLKKVGRVGLNHLGVGRCGTCGTAARTELTSFSRPDGRSGRQNSCWIGCKKQEEQSPKRVGVISPEIENKSSDSWLENSTQHFRILPRVKQMVIGRVELPRRQQPPPLVCIEPAQLPNEGVLASRGLSQLLPVASKADETRVRCS